MITINGIAVPNAIFTAASDFTAVKKKRVTISIEKLER